MLCRCHTVPMQWPCCLVGPSAMVPRATRWQIWLMNPMSNISSWGKGCPAQGLNPQVPLPFPSSSTEVGHLYPSVATDETPHKVQEKGELGPSSALVTRAGAHLFTSLSALSAVTLASLLTTPSPFC